MNRILLLTLIIPGLAFAGANEDFAAGVAAYKKKDYDAEHKCYCFAEKIFGFRGVQRNHHFPIMNGKRLSSSRRDTRSR